MRSPKAIAFTSFVFTYLFFFEYLPPMRWVHIPYDLQGFHYPLADYAFQRLRQGHFPLWDPTIYCGMSFVANIQAALFYPPTWLMFLFSAGRERLSYQAMEDVLLMHVWVGFLLCYFWLRGKRLTRLACVMGAGVFAFSGYLCTQLQHFGLVAAYVWIPLALWGVDQAVERKSWRPLWKVAAASALALLAGYPPTWMVLAAAVGAYSLAGAWRWKSFLGALGALAFSLAICAIQILPTWEATQLREPEARYGLGIKEWNTILAYVLPNYFDFGLNKPVLTNPGKDYFFLGAPALLGLLFLVRRRRFRDLVPSVAILGVTLLVAVNPFNITWSVIRHSTLLPDVVRAWYFLAGVTLAFAPITAFALDDFLASKSCIPSWSIPVSMALMTVWAAYELYGWKSQTLAAGWSSAIYVTVTLAILAAGLFAFRGEHGRRRTWIAAALIFLIGGDYKAFGTSKRFDAAPGDAQRWSFTSFPLMAPDVYRQLRSDRNLYRVAVDFDIGPLPNDFRHIGLTSPQGFDPLLTTRFRNMADEYAHFRTDRLFDIDPDNYQSMRLFGVRYVISSDQSKQLPKLKDNPHYRLLGSSATYYHVFELLDASPVFSWEGSGTNTVEARVMEPEDRVFAVKSHSGGALALREQLFPGWTATVDGTPVNIRAWMDPFLAVPVPPGEHTVEFKYHSRLLGRGAAISAVALLVLAFWIRLSRRPLQ